MGTPPPHISSFPVSPLPKSEQINHTFSNHTYTKSTANHIHHHYSPFVTLTYTTHSISSTTPTYAPRGDPGCVGRHRRSDRTAGQVDREPGWSTTGGMIGLPPLARVMGLGKQHHNRHGLLENYFHGFPRNPTVVGLKSFGQMDYENTALYMLLPTSLTLSSVRQGM